MMISIRGLRAAASILISLGFLVVMANPSSAATTNVTWDVSAHLTTHWDGVTRLVPSDTTPVCIPATDPSVVTHANDATHATHITGSTAWSGMALDYLIGATNYRWQISGSNTTTTGTYDPSTGSFTQAISLRVDWRTCDGATSLCTMTITSHLSGSDYDGGTLPTTGDSVTLVGSAAITPHIGCNALIRMTILGSTVGLALYLRAH